jgi:hypothetical protein
MKRPGVPNAKGWPTVLTTGAAGAEHGHPAWLDETPDTPMPPGIRPYVMNAGWQGHR